MRQRNDTKYEQNVSAWPLHPFTVGVGEEIDFPQHIGGFTLLPDAPPEPEPKSKRKDATVVADMKEGEPQ